jgi:hypothetical protein
MTTYGAVPYAAANFLMPVNRAGSRPSILTWDSLPRKIPNNEAVPFFCECSAAGNIRADQQRQTGIARLRAKACRPRALWCLERPRCMRRRLKSTARHPGRAAPGRPSRFPGSGCCGANVAKFTATGLRFPAVEQRIDVTSGLAGVVGKRHRGTAKDVEVGYCPPPGEPIAEATERILDARPVKQRRRIGHAASIS